MVEVASIDKDLDLLKNFRPYSLTAAEFIDANFGDRPLVLISITAADFGSYRYLIVIDKI